MTDNQAIEQKKPPKKTEKRKIKVLRPSQVVNKKRVLYEFEGQWLEMFGKPENIAKWFITGPSYSGKSSFFYSLCRYLCEFGNLDYDSFEEGNAQTTADKISEYGLLEMERQFKLLPKVPIADLKWRLERKNSAKFAVIDSVQHCRMKELEYIDFTVALEKKGKSLLFVSHWVKDPFTKFVKHDCDIKIEVVGFVARIKSRYSKTGETRHVIWEEGARKYWGKKFTSVANGKFWPYKD